MLVNPDDATRLDLSKNKDGKKQYLSYDIKVCPPPNLNLNSTRFIIFFTGAVLYLENTVKHHLAS